MAIPSRLATLALALATGLAACTVSLTTTTDPPEVASPTTYERLVSVAQAVPDVPIVLPATLPDGFTHDGTERFMYHQARTAVVHEFRRNHEIWVRVCTVPDGVRVLGTCLPIAQPWWPVAQQRRFADVTTLVVIAEDGPVDPGVLRQWHDVVLTQDWDSLGWLTQADDT